MLDLVARSPDPFSRRTYDPGHITASAFVLSPERSELLLVFHGKLAKWLQPGGHVDPSDADVVAAAEREVREETGVVLLEAGPAILFDLDVHPIPERWNEPAHEHFDVRSLRVAAHRATAAASDALDARWFAFDEIDAAATDASVTRALAKIRRGEGLRPRRR
jgi:8-oxo-dGTP pyrophosphatase MutT (NUDIX family)